MKEANPHPSSFEVQRFTTGGEEEQEIIEQRDAFFKSVLIELGFKEDLLGRVPASVIERDLGRQRPAGFDPTDDRLHLLVVANEALAMVLDRRNDGNYHEVTFWSRSLSELPAQTIEEMINYQESQTNLD